MKMSPNLGVSLMQDPSYSREISTGIGGIREVSDRDESHDGAYPAPNHAQPGVFSARSLADSGPHDVSCNHDTASPNPAEPISAADDVADIQQTADRDPDLHAEAGEPRLRTSFDFTVIDGAEGRRLAQVQANAIREVLTWWINHATHETSSTPDQEAA
ncbi:hypothetical protein [Nocardia cyriacigeorgica]|uniref:hypothetical protein n=1 Tax=Nocardia cyriacigeorgica TaxID=135487 RepID=UPI002493B282|nr:hypothetical protein [Nocardia cyriacigeorgica]